MKKIYFVLTLVLLCSCAKSPQKLIQGTWEMSSTHYGLVERTFTGDTVITKKYCGYDGNRYDYEKIEKYTFIDDILYIDDVAYNYSIYKNKLIMLGYYETEIYTKQIKVKSIAENRKFLLGHWQGEILDMTFNDDGTVIIKENDENMNVINEETYSYKITDRIIIIEEKDKKNGFSKNFYQIIIALGSYLYKVNNEFLYLKVNSPEDGNVLLRYILRKQ